jgi:DNA invertase Pin-like site-specific DNA recombinase
VAYYRHSAQDRQENSIPIQQDQVRGWAEKHGVEIIHEFADAEKSGLNAEGRPAFTEIMNDWVKQKGDFEYVLCLDVSRWGRFHPSRSQLLRQIGDGNEENRDKRAAFRERLIVRGGIPLTVFRQCQSHHAGTNS